MAKPMKTGEGTWRVQIMVRGVRDGGTFPTKRAAEDWQARRRNEIIAINAGEVGSVKTLVQALDEYAEKISPLKKGWVKETIRLHAYKRQKLPLNKMLTEVTTSDLAVWRDSRLAVNKPGSVLRDMTLLGNVFEVARREWQWIRSNPMTDVKRPGTPAHRERVISNREIRVMLRTLRYGPKVRSVSNAVAHAFLFALSSGMRAGEISVIRWEDVKTDHVVLHTSKTGSGRQVPLSTVSKRILDQVKGWDDELVFGMAAGSLDANFRKYRIRSGLEGFTFHDSRHTAATRIALLPRMTEMVLCKIFGWKNPKQAMVYFNPSARQMAAML